MVYRSPLLRTQFQCMNSTLNYRPRSSVPVPLELPRRFGLVLRPGGESGALESLTITMINRVNLAHTGALIKPQDDKEPLESCQRAAGAHTCDIRPHVCPWKSRWIKSG
ncbi:unnamed protein product [Pleuronectes platessa]|uniref:Uncharacterized protein n=1 Tax=Pleuronectes platessa TaxID=8262 RepID=A0A9N7Z2G5_PLEPL|nr:unnamed protein product [Pleuronectes platessa]